MQKRARCSTVFSGFVCALYLFSFQAATQDTRSRFEGMWSDPRVSALTTFCSGACTDVGLAKLEALLDDPANDSRSYQELSEEAARYQVEEYLLPKLTEAALADYPLDPASDPGFLYCRPWGVARQTTARHQLQFTDHGDRIDMLYGEWAARRVVYMDDRELTEGARRTPMGFSVGRFEGDEFVIETTAIEAERMSRPARFLHSDQMTIVERYSVSDDGQELYLTVTYEDSWALTEPLVLKKIWSWAPDEEIVLEVDCEIPTDFRRQGESE